MGQLNHSTVRARCAMCGRALSRPGRVVPGIGEVGPECHRKVQALEAFARAAGLEGSLYGGAWVPEDASQDALLRAQAFILRARRSGLRVEVNHVPGGAWVQVSGVERPKAFARAVDSWTAWARELEARAALREVARD
ncbi:hypothetical protein [Thermus brevis]|nr:hypothetical protein [Thermus brevis]